VANPIQESDTISLYLETPILIALVQSRADKICRKRIFCPVDACQYEFHTITQLSNHFHSHHDFAYRKCADIVQFFFYQMFKDRLKSVMITRNEEGHEELVHSDEALAKCYLPHCTRMYSKHSNLMNHIKNREHVGLKLNIDLLG
jgi:hypothetical protein